MPKEPLTLEEQKEGEFNNYVASITRMFTWSAFFTTTQLLIFAFNILSVTAWKKGSGSGLDGILVFLAFIPIFLILPLAYFTIYAFAAGKTLVGNLFVCAEAIGIGVWSKIHFQGTYPVILFWFSVIHEIVGFFYVLSVYNHRARYLESVEFGWDNFDCMDKIVKPGMDQALINLMLKSPPVLEDGVDGVVIEGDKQVAFDPSYLKRPAMPIVALKYYSPEEYAQSFQVSVKGYARQKRQNNEWMQSVKWEDIKAAPLNNAWGHDKIGKSLGKPIRDAHLKAKLRRERQAATARALLEKENMGTTGIGSTATMGSTQSTIPGAT